MDKNILSETETLHFWSKVSKEGPEWNGTPCWIWMGRLQGGYGEFRYRVRGKSRVYVSAHRVAYTLMKGRILYGLHLDHLCRNTLCVNSNHLQPVTNKENSRRANVYRTQAKVART